MEIKGRKTISWLQWFVDGLQDFRFKSRLMHREEIGEAYMKLVV